MLDKVPKFIKNIVESLFIYNNIQIKYFKQQYDPEELEIAERERNRNMKIFSSKQKDNLIYETDYPKEKGNDDFEL